ncbi:hypothetical protein [Candidatus Paracaedibacter symbiosus]|uniref:hypothetical protein n=1 Tax=Candidatus Paracaedibacter symbiosus TaxID=244582 RepID=UPI0012EB75EC|nr:hypothetical protein [Candidatus Paracaedibacter symbiosus]
MRILIALLLSASINVSVVHGMERTLYTDDLNIDALTSSSLSQPSTREIAKLANQVSPEQYVKMFVERGCFNFIMEEYTEPQEEDREVLTEHAGLFYGKLLKVAENPVGRILLHRILGELDRESTETEKRFARDDLKNLKILKMGRWSYSSEKSQLVFEDGNIYASDHISNPLVNSPIPDSEEIYLFHEMLHWFHALNDPEHYDRPLEKKDFYEAPEMLYFFDLDVLKETANLFLEDDAAKRINNLSSKLNNTQKENIASKIRESLEKNKEIIKAIKSDDFYMNVNFEWGGKGMLLRSLEEILTVLGQPSSPADTNGSELSENLFRLAGGYGIRVYYRDFNPSSGRDPHSPNPSIEASIKARILEVAQQAWENIQ